MNTKLEIFDFEENVVRTLFDENGEIWFVANDLCRCLDISDARQAWQRLEEDERGGCIVPTPSGDQEMRCVNEPGLYSLVFTSRKESAQRFKRWVTHEVLPALRKTGRFEMPETPKQIANDLPLDDARHWLNMVREARVCYGKGAARRIWEISPLPQVTPEWREAAPETLDGLGCLAYLMSAHGLNNNG